MKIKTEPVRGMNDFLPQQKAIREYAKSKIIEAYKKCGFLWIETPVMESMEALFRDTGENTKLMFKVLKRGEKLQLNNISSENDLVDCGIRYDFTVPLVRFYANNMGNLISPFKTIQIGDVFRADRPQKGRSRQFVQCDIDILGDASAEADIEVLFAGYKALKNLGFEKFCFGVNDRRILKALVLNCGFKEEDFISVCISLDKLDKIGADGVVEELANKGFDAKNASKLLNVLKVLNENSIDQLTNFGVQQEVVNNLKYIISSLKQICDSGLTVKYIPTLTRGQGYYTSSVFEVYLDGYDGACGGGGRYDNMVEQFIGTSVPAVGFSLGFERLCLLLKQQKTEDKNLAVLKTQESIANIMNICEALRDKGYNVSVFKKAKNFSYQLDKLKATGYRFYINLENGVEIKEIK